jgi:hypothetical protein
MPPATRPLAVCLSDQQDRCQEQGPSQGDADKVLTAMGTVWEPRERCIHRLLGHPSNELPLSATGHFHLSLRGSTRIRSPMGRTRTALLPHPGHGREIRLWIA